MSDYIDRQAAIDAVNGMPDCPNGYSDTYDKAHIIAVLEDVPSAQPEIIRCKDCKHRPTATRAEENIYYGFSVEFPDEQCPCHCGDEWYNWYPNDNFFCAWGERRDV